MLHTRVYFSCMCYQIAPRVLHFSAFIRPVLNCSIPYAWGSKVVVSIARTLYVIIITVIEMSHFGMS